MVEKIPITTLDLPGLEPYRTMKRQFEQRAQGIFVAEGPNVVERLLESGLGVVSVLMPEEWFLKFSKAIEKRPELVKAFIADKKLMEHLAGFHLYQGVLAVGRLPEAASLDKMLARRAAPMLVAAEGVSGVENMGGLVRNCAAFGVDGLLVGETSCSPYLRRAVRSSMGTVFKLPVLQTESLVRTLQELKKARVEIVAAHARAETRTISEVDFREAFCLVLGAEGTGVSKEVLEVCDEAAAIPMAAGIDSLNVTMAGGVFLYEAARQRGQV